jgi:hypothetical protein
VKKNKKEMLDRIGMLDDNAEIHALSEEEWRMRYNLEGELEEVLPMRNRFGNIGVMNSGYY